MPWRKYRRESWSMVPGSGFHLFELVLVAAGGGDDGLPPRPRALQPEQRPALRVGELRNQLVRVRVRDRLRAGAASAKGSSSGWLPEGLGLGLHA